MPNYQIITDSGSDLPFALQQALDVKSVCLSLLFRGQTLPDSVNDDIVEMYQALRQGEVAKTSAVNPDGWASIMEPALQEGKADLVGGCMSITPARQEKVDFVHPYYKGGMAVLARRASKPQQKSE